MKLEVSAPRTIILSDTHLGRAKGTSLSPQTLRPLWAGASHLVINGDVGDESDPRRRAQAARIVRQLNDLCDADGVRLTLLSGRDDPLLADLRMLQLADGAVLVTHGDALHPTSSPWSTHAQELRRCKEQALTMLAERAGRRTIDRLAAARQGEGEEWLEDLKVSAPATGVVTAIDPRAASSQALLHTVRKAALTMWYWQTLPRRAADFLREHAPEARFFVFGHVHRAGVWREGSAILINTGCHGFPGRPRAVVLEGDSIGIWPIQSAGSLYCLANKPMAVFPIRDPLPT